MKTILIIAAGLTLIGWAAHFFLGTSEMKTTKPVETTDKRILTNWFQGFSAWHLITVDLIMLTIIFILIAFTDYLSGEKGVLMVIAVWMIGWTIAWMLTLSSKQARAHFKSLPQWVLFLLIAGCCIWAIL